MVMLVNGNVKKGNQLVNEIFKDKKNSKHQNLIKRVIQFLKNEMWKMFLQTFREKYGYDFIRNEETLENIKILFFYFLQDEEFFKCENLRSDITKPSFKKGLLIIGGYGLGKTDYFSVFEQIFKYNLDLRFKCYAAKSLVLKYEHCASAAEKDYFFKDVSRPKMFIDDIASERFASNYGKVDVIKDVLSNRYDKKLLTYASCNYTNSDQCAKKTLEDIGLRYGPRIYDRFFEMFNIIEFKGSSLRL
jgi:DNA replication protein DnaC